MSHRPAIKSFIEPVVQISDSHFTFVLGKDFEMLEDCIPEDSRKPNDASEASDDFPPATWLGYGLDLTQAIVTTRSGSVRLSKSCRLCD